jgi:hypothetical protein
MIKIAPVLILLSAAARAEPSVHAETYRFDEGKTDESMPDRCGKNISNWAAKSLLTIAGSAGEATTLVLEDRSFGVDRIVRQSHDVTDYFFDTTAKHTVGVQVGGFDCADAHCKQLNVIYTVEVHPDAAPKTWKADEVCHETWRGKMHVVPKEAVRHE